MATTVSVCIQCATCQGACTVDNPRSRHPADALDCGECDGRGLVETTWTVTRDADGVYVITETGEEWGQHEVSLFAGDYWLEAWESAVAALEADERRAFGVAKTMPAPAMQAVGT